MLMILSVVKFDIYKPKNVARGQKTREKLWKAFFFITMPERLKGYYINGIIQLLNKSNVNYSFKSS